MIRKPVPSAFSLVYKKEKDLGGDSCEAKVKMLRMSVSERREKV